MKRLRDIIGIVISLALIWYLFRGTNWSAVGQAMTEVNPVWLILSELAILASLVTRVKRFQIIVSAGQPVGFWTAFNATQIGFLGNYVLPGRLGEIIRAFVLSRLGGLAFVRSVSFAAFDRLTDMFALLVVMIVAAVSFRPVGDIILPSALYSEPINQSLVVSVAWGTATVALILLALMVIVFLNERLIGKLVRIMISPISDAAADWMVRAVSDVSAGLHILGKLSDLARSLAYSGLTWGLMILSYYFLFQAFGFETHWSTYFVLTAFLAVAISIPGAPGFIGQFHFAVTVTIVALMPETDLDMARAVSILAHLLNLVPVIVIGAACLYASNLSLLGLRKETGQVERQQ